MYSTWPRNCVEECFQLPRMGPGVLQQALPMLSTGPGDDTKRFSRCTRLGPENVFRDAFNCLGWAQKSYNKHCRHSQMSPAMLETALLMALNLFGRRFQMPKSICNKILFLCLILYFSLLKF